ncbi:urease accessory protein UreD [Streptomyces lydicus]|uniref:urease accessory protein UreD n=1 Tax=Streptomyces lydicus TaxID=47763 RepID=UPI0036FC8B18
MSAPLGGDRLTIDVSAEDRAALEVTTAAATLALRGPTTDAATYDVRLTAGEHAHLRWLPQPLISAAGSCSTRRSPMPSPSSVNGPVQRKRSGWRADFGTVRLVRAQPPAAGLPVSLCDSPPLAAHPVAQQWSDLVGAVQRPLTFPLVRLASLRGKAGRKPR